MIDYFKTKVYRLLYEFYIIFLDSLEALNSQLELGMGRSFTAEGFTHSSLIDMVPYTL